MQKRTWEEACLLLNDRLGQQVYVAIKATGDITVAQFRGELTHVSPDRQFVEAEAALTEDERDPGPDDLDMRPIRERFDRDLAVYRVGGEAVIDLSDLDYLSGHIESADGLMVIPLDDAAVLELLFTEATP